MFEEGTATRARLGRVGSSPINGNESADPNEFRLAQVPLHVIHDPRGQDHVLSPIADHRIFSVDTDPLIAYLKS